MPTSRSFHSIEIGVILLFTLVYLSSGSLTLQMSFYYDSHSHLLHNTSFARLLPLAQPSLNAHRVSNGHQTHLSSLPHAPSASSLLIQPGPFQFCLIPPLIFWGLNITEANLIPLTLGGMLIGAGGFSYLTAPSSANVKSRVSYAIIFAFFFVMNLGGLILHCFAWTFKSMFVAKVMLFLDGVGTSGVCVSFIFAALTDLNVFSDTGKVKTGLGGVVFVVYLYAWYRTVFHDWPLGFPVLYLLTTVVGSSLYFILQIVWTFKNGFTSKFWYFLSAFLIGMVGLQTLKDPNVAQYLCDHLPHWLAGETPWFFASDLALYLLFEYVTKRENSSAYAKLNSVTSVV